MITLFSTCKPFIDERDSIQQTNAITSWTFLRDTEIILMGNDDGTGEIAMKFGIKHIPDIPLSEQGTPLVSGMWRTAMERGKNDVYCYVNADIILFPDMVDAVELAASQRDHFMLSGRRTNCYIDEPVDFEADWVSFIKENHLPKGHLYAECAIDYFIWRGDFWGEMPDVSVGRYVWDNYLVWRPLSVGVPVIDTTEMITAVHQGHHQLPWDHPEHKGNWEAMGKVKAGVAGLKDTKLYLTKEGIQRR